MPNRRKARRLKKLVKKQKLYRKRMYEPQSQSPEGSIELQENLETEETLLMEVKAILNEIEETSIIEVKEFPKIQIKKCKPNIFIVNFDKNIESEAGDFAVRSSTSKIKEPKISEACDQIDKWKSNSQEKEDCNLSSGTTTEQKNFTSSKTVANLKSEKDMTSVESKNPQNREKKEMPKRCHQNDVEPKECNKKRFKDSPKKQGSETSKKTMDKPTDNKITIPAKEPYNNENGARNNSCGRTNQRISEGSSRHRSRKDFPRKRNSEISKKAVDKPTDNKITIPAKEPYNSENGARKERYRTNQRNFEGSSQLRSRKSSQKAPDAEMAVDKAHAPRRSKDKIQKKKEATGAQGLGLPKIPTPVTGLPKSSQINLEYFPPLSLTKGIKGLRPKINIQFRGVCPETSGFATSSFRHSYSEVVERPPVNPRLNLNQIQRLGFVEFPVFRRSQAVAFPPSSSNVKESQIKNAYECPPRLLRLKQNERKEVYTCPPRLRRIKSKQKEEAVMSTPHLRLPGNLREEEAIKSTSHLRLAGNLTEDKSVQCCPEDFPELKDESWRVIRRPSRSNKVTKSDRCNTAEEPSISDNIPEKDQKIIRDKNERRSQGFLKLKRKDELEGNVIQTNGFVRLRTFYGSIETKCLSQLEKLPFEIFMDGFSCNQWFPSRISYRGMITLHLMETYWINPNHEEYFVPEKLYARKLSDAPFLPYGIDIYFGDSKPSLFLKQSKRLIPEKIKVSKIVIDQKDNLLVTFHIVKNLRWMGTLAEKFPELTFHPDNDDDIIEHFQGLYKKPSTVLTNQ